MKIAIIGTGTMGNGIAQAFAQGGYRVVMKDLSEELLQRAIENIDKSLSKLVEKEKISADAKTEILGRIRPTMSYDDVRDCSLVVEAIAENMELKKRVFRELDEACNADCILATNSSSLSITEIAGCTGRPEKVIGMHFFNPVPMLKLVEVIRGQLTSDSVYECVKGIAEKIGKTPVQVKEAPGFFGKPPAYPDDKRRYRRFCRRRGIERRDRRGHETRCRTPYRPLSAGRFGRARRLPRYHGGASPRVRRR